MALKLAFLVLPYPRAVGALRGRSQRLGRRGGGGAGPAGQHDAAPAGGESTWLAELLRPEAAGTRTRVVAKVGACTTAWPGLWTGRSLPSSRLRSGTAAPCSRLSGGTLVHPHTYTPMSTSGSQLIEVEATPLLHRAFAQWPATTLSSQPLHLAPRWRRCTAPLTNTS